MDLLHLQVLRSAKGMEIYADGDESFCFGDWKAWSIACTEEGRTIPPSEFKALPKEKRRSYLPAFSLNTKN